MEVFEAHLWKVPSDDKDAPQKAATLAAAYGNAGVLAIRQEDVEAGLEWLGKARAALEELKGMNALRDTIRDQYDHAFTLRRYQIGDAKAEVPGESADGESAAPVENSS